MRWSASPVEYVHSACSTHLRTTHCGVTEGVVAGSESFHIYVTAQVSRACGDVPRLKGVMCIKHQGYDDGASGCMTYCCVACCMADCCLLVEKSDRQQLGHD